MSLPATYRKLVAVRPDPDLRVACEVQEVALAAPAPGELLIRTQYSGVNAADYLMAQGRYLAPTPPPYDLGAESTGIVAAVGEGVSGFKEGDAVLVIAGGGYREYFTAQARFAIPVPQATPNIVSLGISGLTASIALEKTGEMTSGETVLVTAAAGGTGSIAVQLAKIAGNTVIGTCGSDDKAAFLRDLGCDRPINYRKENLRQVLQEEFPKGLDIVFESVGGEQFDACVDHLAVMGRLIVIGAISEYETGPQKVNRARVGFKLVGKSASLRGFWLMHYFRYAGEHLPKLLNLLQTGQLQLPVEEQRFAGVEGAIEALEYMYAGKNTGKVVVDFT
jgi:hypothetical protein